MLNSQDTQCPHEIGYQVLLKKRASYKSILTNYKIDWIYFYFLNMYFIQLGVLNTGAN